MHNAEPNSNLPQNDTSSCPGMERRGFFHKVIAAGAAAAGAVLVTRASNVAAQNPVTMALGENGAPIGRPGQPRPIHRPGGQHITTFALGEEGNPPPPPPTQRRGEEGCGTNPITTRAVGEEGSPGPITTKAVGEEGKPSATTMAVGEEGNFNGTTRAYGEEGTPAPNRGLGGYNSSNMGRRIPNRQPARNVTPNSAQQMWQSFRRW